MHWEGGNMSDWYEIAPWLQNRGLANPFADPGSDPWWNPSWFPQIQTAKSYAVLIFTFRECYEKGKGGCTTSDDKGHLYDAQSAMLFAHGLDGVDPAKIVAVGSGIGADGAVDGCEFLNAQFPGSCQGAFSISPGSSAIYQYTDIVTQLGHNTPPTAAWCLADETEIDHFCHTVDSSNDAAYQSYLIQGGGHGNNMLKPGLDPLPMQLILNFLDETLP
jgi:hypothetical protein